MQLLSVQARRDILTLASNALLRTGIVAHLDCFAPSGVFSSLDCFVPPGVFSRVFCLQR